MRRLIFAAALLAACTPRAVPTPPPVVRYVAPVPVAVAPVVPSASGVAALTPAGVIVASDRACRDATDYVAWKHSRPENIDRLTVLTSAVQTSVRVMRAGEVRGRYRAVDVIAARSSLRQLLAFLADKGD